MSTRHYLRQLIGFTVAGVLWMTSLYQLEIVTIWQCEGRTQFEFPFYIWTTNLWVARDVWYAVNGLAILIAMASGITLGSKRARRRSIAQNKD